MNLSDHELEVLTHSLGINLYHAKRSKLKRDKKLPNKFYRSFFHASEGHSDYSALLSLEGKGYMERGVPNVPIHTGSIFFYVTEAGEQAFRENFIEFITPTVAL